MKKIIISVAVLSAIIPVAAFANTSVGVGYSNVHIAGHGTLPAANIFAGDLYSNNVVAWAGATLANGYDSVHMSVGKRVQAGYVVVEPFVTVGFMHANYAPTAPIIDDTYGLAGADMYVPITPRVDVEVGGGYGHTIATAGGIGGPVYRGNATLNFGLAKHVVCGLDVTYTHLPAMPNIVSYGAGISYHFS